jgi:hypothetical protein
VSAEHCDESILLDCERDRINDPLLRNLDLSYFGLFYPYGFPLKVTSNSSTVIEALRKSFGRFQRASDAPPIEFEVTVEGDETGPMPGQPLFRTRRHLLTLAYDSEHFGTCDFEAGYAHLRISPRALRDLPALRYFFLDAMALSLICERHLVPVHAACIALNGSGALLCGRSTAGKSSLAYACARRGFTYVCDDGSFLVRSASDRTVTGNCHSIRFRPSAAELFPELQDIPAIRRANGKMAIEVPVRTLGLDRLSERCRVDHIVFLNRQPAGPARLQPSSTERARTEFVGVLAYGRDASITDQQAALERLLDVEILELTYSDPDSAADALEALLLNRGVA